MGDNNISIELKHESGGAGQGVAISSSIISIALKQGVNSHHLFEVRVHADAIEGKDEQLFIKSKESIGKKIKIRMLDTLFVGIVTKVSASKRDNAQGDLIISGMSPTFLLDDHPHTQSYSKKTLEEIIKQSKKPYPDNEINFKNANINPEFKARFDYLTQYDESCFEFINRLAFNFGEWFFYDGMQSFFGLPKGKSDRIQLNFGSDLTSFDVSLRVDHSDFKIIFYDYEKNKAVTKTNNDSTIPSLDDLTKFALNISKNFSNFQPEIFTYFSNADVVNDLMKLEVATNASQLVVFNGVSTCSKLKVGTVVEVKRKGNAAGKKEENYGTYRIVNISHSCTGDGNYENYFQAIPEALKSPPGINRRLKPVAPAQPAIVKKNIDPLGLGRVQVQFFWQENDEMTPFIRVVTSHGGDGRGFYFIPEIGDEVLVSFYDNNPDDPYVAGSMFHGKAKPGGVMDKNLGKGIITIGGNSILFSDEKDKEKISIFNKKNQLILDCDGDGTISILSDGKIKIKAKKSIEISSDEDMILNAGGNFSVSGGNNSTIDTKEGLKLNGKEIKVAAKTDASIKSDASISIEGLETSIKASAKMDLDGGAMASLTGAIVKIN